MLDVDFLGQTKTALRQHVLYGTDSNALRPQVHSIVRGHADQRGIPQRELDYTNPAYSARESSLFGEYLIWIDLDTLTETRGKNALDDFIDLATLITEGTPENRLYLFGAAPKMKEHPAWATLAKSVTYIEETPVSDANIARILDYAARDLGLLHMANKPAWVASMKEYANTDEVTLSDFLHAVELYATLCTTFPIGQPPTFDTVAFNSHRASKVATDYYRWQRLLSTFLTQPTKTNAAALTRELDTARHNNGFEPRALFTILSRTTQDLFYVSEALNKSATKPGNWSDFKWGKLRDYRGVPPARLLSWNVLLAKFEPELNRGDWSAWHTLCDTLIKAV